MREKPMNQSEITPEPAPVGVLRSTYSPPRLVEVEDKLLDLAAITYCVSNADRWGDHDEDSDGGSVYVTGGNAIGLDAGPFNEVLRAWREWVARG